MKKLNPKDHIVPSGNCQCCEKTGTALKFGKLIVCYPCLFPVLDLYSQFHYRHTYVVWGLTPANHLDMYAICDTKEKAEWYKECGMTSKKYIRVYIETVAMNHAFGDSIKLRHQETIAGK